VRLAAPWRPNRCGKPHPTRLPIAAAVLTLLAACAGDGAAGPPEEAASAPAPAPIEAAPEPAPEAPPAPDAPRKAERLAARVIAEYPHDPSSFTQGLLVHDGALYESTGQYGRSRVRKLAPESGEVLAERRLEPRLFGEGLALVTSRYGGRLVQLTWREGVALLWDPESLEPRGELSYRGEGWGLTFDGERLILSDGGSALSFRDPGTLEETGRIEVTLDGEPVFEINELEWQDGFVWANVLGSSSVLRIDPESGEVTAVADLSSLRGRIPAEESQGMDVLNGIAWWPERESFLVTGKDWPRLFEVVFE
jgi:glutaminyl-peptide cyclotransferase